MANAEHWLERAGQARVTAEQMSDPYVKQEMLSIMEAYLRLADYAMEKAAKEEKPKHESEALPRSSSP